MDYIRYTEKLKDMKFFIERGMAVTVDDLSVKLGISRRTVLRMVDHLKTQGLTIRYSRRQQAYYIKVK